MHVKVHWASYRASQLKLTL